MDRLLAMQVFATVAECGSFTAAAERLDLSRAMATRHVESLEQWLGARLLHRTTRRVSLTDAGAQCLRYSQQMLALADEVQGEMRAGDSRSEEHTSELQSQSNLVCRLLLEKKKKK